MPGPVAILSVSGASPLEIVTSNLGAVRSLPTPPLPRDRLPWNRTIKHASFASSAPATGAPLLIDLEKKKEGVREPGISSFSFPTPFPLRVSLATLRGGNPGLQLDAVPALDLVAQGLVDHALLLEHVDAAEALRGDLDAVHGPAAARDVLHGQLRGRELGHEQVPDLGLGVVEEVGLLEGGRGGGLGAGLGRR